MQTAPFGVPFSEDPNWTALRQFAAAYSVRLRPLDQGGQGLGAPVVRFKDKSPAMMMLRLHRGDLVCVYVRADGIMVVPSTRQWETRWTASTSAD